MYINNHSSMYPNFLRMAHHNSEVFPAMSNCLISWIPTFPLSEYIVICIGTDRSTGDSFGPLVGSFLKEKPLRKLIVYGTLHNPIHANNLEASLKKICLTHKNPYIIAVDACLGHNKSVGCLIAKKGSIKPGEALNKELSAVGDCSITGVVNINNLMQYTVLQSTRLSIVFDMANTVASILTQLDGKIASLLKE